MSLVTRFGCASREECIIKEPVAGAGISWKLPKKVSKINFITVLQRIWNFLFKVVPFSQTWQNALKNLVRCSVLRAILGLEFNARLWMSMLNRRNVPWFLQRSAIHVFSWTYRIFLCRPRGKSMVFAVALIKFEELISILTYICTDDTSIKFHKVSRRYFFNFLERQLHSRIVFQCLPTYHCRLC